MINRLLEKISGKWIFIIIVSFFYGILAFANLTSAKMAIIQSFQLMEKILPTFLLISILLFISNLFLDSKKIINYIGKNSGIKGWLLSIITGVLSSGPIYMWYPLLSDLKERGMKDSLITAFLYNRAVKIPLLPMMIYYFGWSFTLVLTFYMIVFSIINGILVSKLTN